MKKILFTIGTHNQTTMMHQIYEHLKSDYECWFSTFYGDGLMKFAADNKLVEMSIAGQKTQKTNADYCSKHGLNYDYRGLKNIYDLAILCQDIAVPKNLEKTKKILVQEGTIVPIDWKYKVVKALNWPRYLADTSMTGQSNAYEAFCIASEGYKQEFISRGAKYPERLVVTGIPNFDDVQNSIIGDFPYENFVLVATSNLRETFNKENRKAFIEHAVKIANGKTMIFKLHPHENHKRAIREIKKYAPKDSIIFDTGNIVEMIAKCSVLVTHFSSVSLLAAALNKPVYSEYSTEHLQALKPLQTNGKSAWLIANIAKEILENPNYQISDFHKITSKGLLKIKHEFKTATV